MSDSIKINAQIEIDVERGVIYVHNTETGITFIRIQNMPYADQIDSVDIRYDQGLKHAHQISPISLPFKH